jgi:hypothetical protein
MAKLEKEVSNLFILKKKINNGIFHEHEFELIEILKHNLHYHQDKSRQKVDGGIGGYGS